VSQNNFDLSFHHVLRWMGGSPVPPPIHRRTQHGLSSPVGSLLGSCKVDAAAGPAAAAEAAGSGFALEGEPLGAAGRCAGREHGTRS
jgi:hypothetical protein